MERKGRLGGLAQLATIAYRNIYRNRRRSTFCVLAVAISVFFIVAMAAVMEGMMDNFRRKVITYETGHVLITSNDYERKSAFLPVQYPVEPENRDLGALLRELKGLPGVEVVFPRIRTRVSLLNSVAKSALLWGIDMEQELPHNLFNYKTRNANRCLVEGRYPAEEANECAIGFRLARKMGVGVGDKVQLRIVSSELSTKYYFPVVTGIVDLNLAEMDKNVVIIPFERAQRLTALQGRTQTLQLFARSEGEAASVLDAVKAELRGREDLSIKPYTLHPFLTILKVSEIMMSIVYIIFMIVASFLIMNTVIMVIHERMKEIGMMAALGMTRAEIVLVFFVESLVLSGLGSALGCLASGAATLILSYVPIDLSSMMEEMLPVNNTVFVKFSPSIIGTGLLYGLSISAACTILPSLKSAFIKPVDALRR